MKIFSIIMHDGSRHFESLPESIDWDDLRDHIALLPGAQITGFVTDQLFEVWIDFTYRGHRFSVNNPFDSYWFFVEDPQCPEEILIEVIAHCEQATGNDTL